MKIKNGIHTFSLTVQCSYSDIQNICTANICILKKSDAYCLNHTYQITAYKDIGVEILLHQSLSRRSWMKVIVNPSSLLEGEYCPTGLFQCRRSEIRQVKKKLRKILKQIGFERELKDFKLSRLDLTRDAYYESADEVTMRLQNFKKSYVMPRYQPVSFKEYAGKETKARGANQHSWTIASGQCAFSVYDKSWELNVRHGVVIEEHILRQELRLERKRIRQMTDVKHWWEQLVEIYEQQDKQMDKFLHRLYQDFDRIVPLEELMREIDASGFREKNKKRMRRLAKRMDGCESLTAAQKSLRMKKKCFIELLERFRKLGISPIPQKEEE